MIAPAKSDLTASEALSGAEAEATWLIAFDQTAGPRIAASHKHRYNRLLRTAFADDVPLEELRPEPFVTGIDLDLFAAR